MYTFLIILQAISAIFLILVVLLQQGKGAGMGAAFGGSSQTLFGGRGQTTPMQKITAFMAIMFMGLSIALTAMGGQDRSALSSEAPPPGQEAGMGPSKAPDLPNPEGAAPPAATPATPEKPAEAGAVPAEPAKAEPVKAEPAKAVPAKAEPKDAPKPPADAKPAEPPKAP